MKNLTLRDQEFHPGPNPDGPSPHPRITFI